LSEKEVGLYALKVIPKVEALSQANQGVQRDNDQSTPHVLTKGEIMKRVTKIQLGPNLHLEEKK
jgi:hypothetical protein